MKMSKQVTKVIEGKMYSFNSRWNQKEDAREKAQKLNGKKHAYYVRITEKGEQFYDVRTEN